MKDITIKVEKINDKWYVSNDDFLDMKIICEKEIERLNNIINEVNKLLNTLEEINENYEVEDTDSLYSKKWLRETIEEMRKVINGRNE